MFTKLSAKLKSYENRLGRALGTNISTPAERRRAYWHFQLLDHGMLRTFWTNLYEIAPGAWRSNQPSPRRIHKYKAMGIRTVLNLRGVNKASPYLFEKEACDKVGLTLVTQRLQARSLPAREVLLELLDMLETIQHPFVMHCKSGADRAGLAAACYMLHVRGVPIKEAKKQLSVKFLHLKSFQTGILDHMLVAYETDTAEKPMAFRKWIETRYNNKRLTATFNADRGKT